MFRSLVSGAVAVGVAVFAVMVFQAFQVPSRQVHATADAEVAEAFGAFDFAAAAERLAQSLRVKTVSRTAGEVSHPEGFLKLHDMFEADYPLVHKALVREVINGYSLLYTWKGSEPDGEGARPVLLTSHMDVVPCPEHNLDRWDYEPFAGHIIDGYIYGRGSMDDKLGVLSILEAVEVLLSRGFQPRRTVYLAFGHDEEVGGMLGATHIVKTLQQRGVRLDFVLDEGGMLGDGLLPGVDKPVAMVAIAEKGYVSLMLEATHEGGHSSMPPVPNTPIGVVGAAIGRLEASPLPARPESVLVPLQFLSAESASVVNKLAAAYPRLFSPVLDWVMSKDSTMNAALRTVTSPTMMEGSEKENVMPTRARIVVNFRIIPGDTIGSVIEHVKRVINDPRVNVTVVSGDESEDPSPISPIDSKQFSVLQTSIAQIFPDYYQAPFITVGMTDARHYHKLCDHVYRFVPFFATKLDMKRFHGINERIHVQDSERSIKFFFQLIQNLDRM